jgi:ribosomal-protein-alanine N-acetyltransferase
MNITYRKASKEDKKSLLDLAVEFTKFNVSLEGDRDRFFWEGWEKDFPEEVETDLAKDTSFYFIAEADDKKQPVGYILARYCKECYYFIIDELFVLDDYRSHNVGKQLLDMAIAEGKKYTNQIRVEIFLKNEGAKKFYLRNGFKEDALVLELGRER